MWSGAGLSGEVKASDWSAFEQVMYPADVTYVHPNMSGNVRPSNGNITLGSMLPLSLDFSVPFMTFKVTPKVSAIGQTIVFTQIELGVVTSTYAEIYARDAMFSAEIVDVPDPNKVTNVAISGPAQIKLMGAKQAKFSSVVTPANGVNEAVTWSVTGPATIDATGLVTLTAGAQDGDTVVVTATSNYTNTVVGTKTITVSEVVPEARYEGLVETPITESTTNFKMNLYVKDIQSNMGAFGIDWDESVLELVTPVVFKNGAVLYDDIENPAIIDNTNGSYQAAWILANMSGGNIGEGANAIDSLLAELTFKFKTGKNVNDLYNGSFVVQNWTEREDPTSAGDADPLNDELWSTSDSQYYSIGYVDGELIGPALTLMGFEFDFPRNNYYKITYTVVDEDDDPIKGAEIDVNGKTLTTDDDGKAFVIVPDGSYPYEASKPGYEDKSGTAVVSGDNINVKVVLEKDEFEVTWSVVNGKVGTATSGGPTTIPGATEYQLPSAVVPNASYSLFNATIAVTIDGVAYTDYSFDTLTGIFKIPAADVVGDIVIEIELSNLTYEIKAIAQSNGAITDPGVSLVNHGADKAYTITANAGYVIDQIFVNGNIIAVAEGTETMVYNFINVQADQDIIATFKTKTDPITPPTVYHVITVTHTEGGTTSPAGKTFLVKEGDDFSVSYTPDAGYELNKVLWNDADVTAAKPSYIEILSVTSDHRVHVVFNEEGEPPVTPDPEYKVTATVLNNKGGYISPNGETTYAAGATPIITMTPDGNHKIKEIVVNGSIISLTTNPRLTDGPTTGSKVYTFVALTADVTITVEYEKVSTTLTGLVDYGWSMPSVTNDGSVKSATITVYEAGTTTVVDTISTNLLGFYSLTLPIDDSKTYDILVRRHGSLKYKITGLKVPAENKAIKTIVMTAGDADRNETIISLVDMSYILNGFGDRFLENADINESTAVNALDLAYAENNLRLRDTTITWTAFQ